MVDYVDRADTPDDYKQMLKTESHHHHKIVSINGVLRWEENPDVRCFLESISLNDLCPLLTALGFGKNSEVYRKLYRDMGYSLSGYWEIFYWEMNNEDCDNYVQPVEADTLGFCRWLYTSVWPHGDADGGELQDMGVKFGILKPEEVTERCGEYCRCAEWDDFPQTCYRLSLTAKPESEATK